VLAHSPTGGFWYGEREGGDWQNVPCPGRSPGAGTTRHSHTAFWQNVPSPGRSPGAGPPGCAIPEQGLPAMPCETQADPVQMSHISPLPKGPPAQPVPYGPLLSTRRGRKTRWQCGGAEEARRRCTWYTLARSWSPIPLALVPDEVGLLTVSGPSGLLNRVDELLNKRKCPCSLLSHALSGGWAGAEKAVECVAFQTFRVILFSPTSVLYSARAAWQ
jgi:hypothetical protein